MPEGFYYMPKTDPAPAVVFERISKSFGKQCVLDDVSLVIPKGAVMVMLGPSAPASRCCCAAWSA